MLQGKELILATKPYAKEIRWKSWWTTLSTIAVLALSITSTILIPWLWVKFLLSILTGLTIVRLFVIYHDYLHKTILKKSIIADFIFTIFGLFILAPKSIWTRSHDHHHKHNSKLYTSSIGSFPIVTKQKFLSSPRSERNIYLFIRHPLTISFGYIFAFAYGMCINSILANPKKHWDSALSLVFHFSIAVLIIYLLGIINFLTVFMIPILIACAMGSYLFYAQHNFPGVTFEDKDGWTYEKAAMHSSSYMRMNAFMHWFTANIGYHHIHHMNAHIPFYRLPEVYNAIPELQQAKTTSLLPKDVLNCLRLKVWDPEKQKMIGLREIYS